MKSEKAKEYLNSLPREVIRRHVGMPEVIEAVELAEQEAEERMRAKAVKVYCRDCCCTVIGKCGIGAENCVALRDFIQKLNEE
jgi:hypothetical protein